MNIGSAAARDRSPPRSETTIGALIKAWRASGPSAPYWPMGAFFGRNKGMRPMVGLYWSAAARTAAL